MPWKYSQSQSRSQSQRLLIGFRSSTVQRSFHFLEAILPASIEGIGNENVFVVKNVVDIRKLDDYIQAHGAKNIAKIINTKNTENTPPIIRIFFLTLKSVLSEINLKRNTVIIKL